MRISDWSSDVCSSDLVEIIIAVICFGRASGDGHDAGNAEWISFAVVVSENSRISSFIADRYHVPARLGNPEVTKVCPSSKIGRASCRERVCQYVEISVVVVSLKKKEIKTRIKI